jgi:hypothetical protein
MDLVEVGWGDVDWIALAQDRDKWRTLVNWVLNLRVPLNAGKLSSVLPTRDLSSSAQLLTVSQYIYLTCDMSDILNSLRKLHHVVVVLPRRA